MGPVFKAVKGIVHGHGNYHVFSYRHDFRKLWLGDETDGGADDETDAGITRILKKWNEESSEEYTVVIVWDGMPEEGDPDHINVGRFVSPHDWAMAASWIIYDKECLKDLKLRVLILKVDPSGSSFASGSLYAFQNALPWIQDYRVVGTEYLVTVTMEDMLATKCKGFGLPEFALVRQSFSPETRDLKMFVTDLSDPKRILTTHSDDDDQKDRRDVLLTRDLWKQHLLKAGTRHSVANLIAPTVLADGLPEDFRGGALKKISAGSLQREALISALSEVRILEKGTSGADNNSSYVLENERHDNVFGRQNNIKFVLVDDHFDLGYNHVLAYTLFGESEEGCWKENRYCWIRNGDAGKKTGCLTCYKNLDWLISQLEKVSISKWDQPRYLFKGECDVLFLDLRLWEDGNKGTRRKVIKQILFAAAKLLVKAEDVGDSCLKAALNEAKSLRKHKKVSPNFVKAFQTAKEAHESEDQDKFSPEALTLLPLLLSHIDRTLPIVLFTSSHQRVVSEMLQDYRNIITTFVKPLISGYGEEISPADSMKDLTNAIGKAIELHEARIAWERICGLEPKNADYIIIKEQNCKEPGETPVFTIFGDRGHRKRCGDVNFGRDKCRLIKRLAELFETCVFDNSVYESISQPWEFLECEIARCGPIYYEKIQTSSDRGKLANALKETRILKTHGKLERDEFTGVKPRWVAILQLLFLLDFLGAENYSRHETVESGLNGEPKPSDKTRKRVLWKLCNNVRDLQPRNFLHSDTEDAMLKLMTQNGLTPDKKGTGRQP